MRVFAQQLFSTAEEAVHAPALPIGALLLVGAAFIVVLVVVAFATGFIGKAGRPEGAPDDDIQPIVGGIAVGKAGPPKWMYLAYVVIPALAAVYIAANSSLPRPKADPAAHEATPAAPASTPVAAASEPIRIVSKGIQFDAKSLTLVAGAPAKIDFDNKDAGVPHNVAIYGDATLAKTIYKGALISGPKKITYAFTAPAAGTYYFQCDVHPNMSGPVTVA